MSKKGKTSRRKYVIAVLGAIAVGFAGLIFNKIRRGPSQLQQTTIAYETTKKEISQTGEKEVSQSAFTTYRSTREITANDFLPEQINVIDTLARALIEVVTISPLRSIGIGYSASKTRILN